MIDQTTTQNNRAPLMSERARTAALLALIALISLAASLTALL